MEVEGRKPPENPHRVNRENVRMILRDVQRLIRKVDGDLQGLRNQILEANEQLENPALSQANRGVLIYNLRLYRTEIMRIVDSKNHQMEMHVYQIQKNHCEVVSSVRFPSLEFYKEVGLEEFASF